MEYKKRKLWVTFGVLVIMLIITAPAIRAQGYPPGFDLRIEWEHYEEQSKDQLEVGVSQVGARIGYSFPQTFDLFVALHWEDIDAKFDRETIDLDPALAFRVGGKLYVVRAIPLGVPTDFTLSLSYSTAKHEEEETKYDFKHRQIIGMGGLEWRYVRSIPYLRLGVLSSEIDTPDKDFDQTSFLIAAGLYAPFIENVYLRIEVNMCQEIGYALGVQYRF
jgi:hypothetical protein